MPNRDSEHFPEQPDRAEEVLLRGKARLLAFLERRLGNRTDAEDVLQTAFLRLASRRASLRDEDKVVPWFYQTMRNLLIDHYRARAAADGLRARFAESAVAPSPDEELVEEAGACIRDVLETLKPEYADIIRRVYFEEQAPARVARTLGITANNVSVRLHRARRALRDGLRRLCGACLEHRCVGCPCRKRGRGLGGPRTAEPRPSCVR